MLFVINDICRHIYLLLMKTNYKCVKNIKEFVTVIRFMLSLNAVSFDLFSMKL